MSKVMINCEQKVDEQFIQNLHNKCAYIHVHIYHMLYIFVFVDCVH